MEPVFPKNVISWWTDDKLYIRVIGVFDVPGHSINVLAEGGKIPTFKILAGYDGSPYTGNIYPYDETIWFSGPYIVNILIIDGNGTHNLTVQKR